MKKRYYKTKALLNRYGAIEITCKVSSKLGTSVEIGRATGNNVKTAISFLLETALIQCKFGHFEHLGLDWSDYYSSSNNFLEDTEVKITITNYNYLYDELKGDYKYKNITVKGKRYIQTFRKSGNRYVFDGREKVHYVRTNKINNIQKDLKLGR